MRGVQNLGLARRASFNFAYVYANPVKDLSQNVLFAHFSIILYILLIFMARGGRPINHMVWGVGGKAEKSYGLGSGAGRPKNHMVWGVGRHCKKMNKSKTNKTPR